MNVGSQLYGNHHRFAIRKCVDRERNFYYMVHDASWIADDEIGKGHSSPTVAQFDTLEQAKEWCDKVEEGKFYSIPHEANFEGWPELKERVSYFMEQIGFATENTHE